MVAKTKLFTDLMNKKKPKDDSDSGFKERNKNKEFQENLDFFKKQLSPETLKAIQENPEKMEEIIEGLKRKGIFKGGNKNIEIDLESFVNKMNKRNLSR